MKIAINWTFSSWKTTLVELLKGGGQNVLNLNKNCTSIISPERELAKELNYNFNNHTLQEENNFQEKLFKRILELEKKDFITDTSLFVCYAYSNENIQKEIIKHINYDLVYHCEPLNIDDDLVRHNNKNYQLYIDNKIKELYKLLNIEPIYLKGNVKKRFNLIIK